MTPRAQSEAERVLVTGATSDIGSALVPLLVADGVQVRAMCREQSQQAALKQSGAEPVLADFDDESSLRAAMTGCSTLFLVTAPTPDQLNQEKRAIDTAKAVGVSRVVRISAADSNRVTAVPWANAHGWADHYLADSGLNWTILRPTAFMQNLAQQAPTIRLGLLPQTTGRGEVAMIDTSDIAAVAHRVIVEDGHDRATYFLTGPESLTMGRVAEVFSERLGKRVRFVQLPSWIYAVALRAAGQSWWTARGLRVQFAEVIRSGHDVDVTSEVARLIGRPAHTLRDYVQANREQFTRG